MISREIICKLAIRNKGLGCRIANATIIQSDAFNVGLSEQECHFNVSRVDGLVHVCCSSQLLLTKLRKMPNFTVTEILVSPDDLILQMRGTLPLKALSLRRTCA